MRSLDLSGLFRKKGTGLQVMAVSEARITIDSCTLKLDGPVEHLDQHLFPGFDFFPVFRSNH